MYQLTSTVSDVLLSVAPRPLTGRLRTPARGGTPHLTSSVTLSRRACCISSSSTQTRARWDTVDMAQEAKTSSTLLLRRLNPKTTTPAVSPSSAAAGACGRGSRCSPCCVATTSACTRTRRRATPTLAASPLRSRCPSASGRVSSTSPTATPSARTCCGSPRPTASTCSRPRTGRTCWPGSGSSRRAAAWTRRWESWDTKNGRYLKKRL